MAIRIWRWETHRPMRRIEFRILGPLDVRSDGESLDIGGPKQRALLALLLLSANRVVSCDRLIEELWPDHGTAAAEKTLRVSVARLRTALAGGEARDQRLTTRAPGYLLHVEPDELDLQRFEQLVAAGRQALQDGDFAVAAARLSEAESLWLGRPLADLEFEPFARLDVERLEELRLAAAEDRIDAELALGRHGLVPALEALIAEHPLRERLRGQLMLALYRAGRQADALGTYRAGRALLVDELGLEPTPHLRQLEQAILHHDGALDLREAAGHRPATTVLADPPPPDLPQAADPGPPPDRTRRGMSSLAPLVLIGIGLAAVAITVLGGSGRRAVPGDGNALVALAADDGHVRRTLALAAPPTDVAAGFGSLWVSEASAGVVVRVDLRSRAPVATIPVGRRPSRVVAAAGQVWVLDPRDRTLSRIEPDTGAMAQTIAVGRDPRDVVFSAGSLWVSNHGDGSVARIDPRNGHTERLIALGGGPRGLAVVGGAVWVADDESGVVVRIDARTGTILGRIRLGGGPTAIAANAGSVWVLDPLDATLLRIDPRRSVVEATVPLAGAPRGLAVFDGSVWVADAHGGALLRVDPGRATVSHTIRVGGSPRALASAGGLWVARQAGATDHRGGTLSTVEDGAVVDSIDPAAGTSANLSPPRLFGLSNDGLVTLNHVTGPDGARLTPDLALALPTPADGARTYAFRLRPGIRYSTGALVKPSDVTHSLERVFVQRSSGASFYDAIAGARACRRAPGSCDLSRGIVADDRAGTVTFRLSRPDPEFLYKLTLTFADVLPASIPGRETRRPLPATGPYMFSSFTPGRQLRLVRNPRFHEWSAAAQPNGYPDRIIMRLGFSGPRAAAMVAAGNADFMPNTGGVPGQPPYFLRQHRGQMRINPIMATNDLVMNVTAAPFDDIRVRRALNLALDRGRIVAGQGGPLAATPTCQILPPGMPGYRRYCPYTRDPGPDGRWHSPDLARAKRLIAASGTAGMKVTVWDSTAPDNAVKEGRITAAALRQLGYRATLRQLPDSTYFTYTNDSRNHAQVIDGGTGPDYPSANTFIGGSTCAYFVPGDGVANRDPTSFCDPAFDRQVARALALQQTNRVAADALWARLDRKLTDLAIWLPTVTPNETDLISKRVRNFKFHPLWGPLIDQLWVR